MRKILILILSSTNNFFSNQYHKLKKFYDTVIEENGFNMAVYGYVGGSDNNHIDNDNIIHLNCNDHKTDDKFICVNNIIRDTDGLNDFDVVIKTNTSTVLNLYALNALIQDDRFNLQAIHGPSGFISHYMNAEQSEYIVYPQGYFTMYSPEVMNQILTYWNQAEQYLRDKNLFYVDENVAGWWGYGDDTVFGAALKLYAFDGHGVELRNIWEELELIPGSRFCNNWTNSLSSFDTVDELRKHTSMILCKMHMHTSMEDRERNEPTILDFGCFLLRYPSTDLQLFPDSNLRSLVFNSNLTCNFRPNDEKSN